MWERFRNVSICSVRWDSKQIFGIASILNCGAESSCYNRNRGVWVCDKPHAPLGLITEVSLWPTLRVKTILQTFSDGCLGSHNDEGRSELRYAVWIAEFSESLDCWTQKAPSGFSLDGTSVSVFLSKSMVGLVGCAHQYAADTQSKLTSKKTSIVMFSRCWLKEQGSGRRKDDPAFFPRNGKSGSVPSRGRYSLSTFRPCRIGGSDCSPPAPPCYQLNSGEWWVLRSPLSVIAIHYFLNVCLVSRRIRCNQIVRGRSNLKYLRFWETIVLGKRHLCPRAFNLSSVALSEMGEYWVFLCHQFRLCNGAELFENDRLSMAWISCGTCCGAQSFVKFKPEIRRDYPLNLSI